ncbi:MAG: carboxypeptidase-like regulatory domain-containing protein, partial [Vicinamibacterales bacterium]
MNTNPVRSHGGGLLLSWLFAVGLILLALPASARAQVDAGALRALIADQSGAIVPGATVTLTNAATGVSQGLVSDSAGYVAFSPIQRGNY